MRRFLIPLLVLSLLGTGSGDLAQRGARRPQLRFGQAPPRGAIVHGKVPIRVEADPLVRPRPVVYAVQVDGQDVRVSSEAPFGLLWDSAEVADGRHLLRLVVREARSGRDVEVIEGASFTTDNAPAAPPPVARAPRAPAPPPPEPRRETEPEAPRPETAARRAVTREETALPASVRVRRPGLPDRRFSRTVAGVPVQAIEVYLTDPRVRVSVQVAAEGIGTNEPFEAMVRRARPAVAINGAYFSKSTLAPIGDIVVQGRLVHAGLMGTALAITRDNRALIRRVQRNHAEDWSRYETVLACGPALVLDGRVDVQAAEEGFHDPHVMNPAGRMAVGLTAEGRMLIVTTSHPVSFAQFANVMRELGCRSAMNLDAGASRALYYRGATLVRPGRSLTNLLVVHVDP